MLKDLPKDLDQTYQRLLTRAIKSAQSDITIRRIEKIFSWLLCAQRYVKLI